MLGTTVLPILRPQQPISKQSEKLENDLACYVASRTLMFLTVFNKVAENDGWRFFR